jgi:hypothetical protein
VHVDQREGAERGSPTCLRGYKLLEITDSIVLVALNTDLLAKTVIEDDFNHDGLRKRMMD